MAEFWEKNFLEKHEMWGAHPTRSALRAKQLFTEHNVKTVLVPGFGYGRNAYVFQEAQMKVTGIEISETAIRLARDRYGNEMTIHHGSVTNMPFDECRYDGIYCHALIHLLDESERAKLILDCYRQLAQNGMMLFTAISKQAPNYGKGKLISTDRYEYHKGAPIYFYDEAAVQREFGKVDIVQVEVVQEDQPMYLITCQK